MRFKLQRARYKQYIKALFFPKKKMVVDYEERWKTGIHQNRRTVEINGRPAIQTGLEYKRILVEELDKRIKSLCPKTVLEIGSGNGLNILALAARNPSIEFRGIEPTEMGIAQSAKFAENPPQELAYLGGGGKVVFEKKSLFELCDNEADLVFTANVLILIDDRDAAIKKYTL